MLSIYTSPRSTDYGSDGGTETLIPAGTPYLTTLKGQLVLARHKGNTKIRGVRIKGPVEATAKTLDLTRTMEAALDFLGEAFGIRGRSARKRVNLVDKPSSTPILHAALPSTSNQPLTYSASLPQVAFSTISNFPPLSVPQPIQYALPLSQPVHPDLDQLRRIDAHYKWINGQGVTKIETDNAKHYGNDSEPTVSIAKNTCANCSIIRSKRYYAEHSIKPGEMPVQKFYRRRQRDTSSTDGSSNSGRRRGDKHSKAAKFKDPRRNKTPENRVYRENNSSMSPEQEEQHNTRSKNRKVNVKPVSDRFEKQRADYRPRNSRNASEYISNENSLPSQNEWSDNEIRTRGRSRIPVEESEISERSASFGTSTSRLRTSGSGTSQVYYNTSGLPLLRHGCAEDSEDEHSWPVNQYTRAHNACRNPSIVHGSHRHQRAEKYYESRYSEGRLRSSQESVMQDDCSIPPTRSDRENTFESSPSRLKDSAPVHLHSHKCRNKNILPQHKKLNILPSWSEYNPQHTTEHSEEQQNKAVTYGVTQQTNYHGNQAFDKVPQRIRNWKCGGCRDKQKYCRDPCRVMEKSNLEGDSAHEIRAGMSSFHNISQFPTPPLHRNESWSSQQSSRVGFEVPYSQNSQDRTPNQHTFRLAPAAYGTNRRSTSLAEDRKESDSFYVSIENVLNEHLYTKEHIIEAGGLNRVKFQESDKNKLVTLG